MNSTIDFAAAKREYEELKSQGLSLNMTRGKPSVEQLNLSNPMLHILDDENVWTEDGIDCRNYGQPEGIVEARQLFADMLKVPLENVIVPTTSSLEIMYDILIYAIVLSLPGAPEAWAYRPKRKILCPSPGYDRHFALSETMGFESILIDMTPEGPDMKQVREAIDKYGCDVKAMWCVPIYSNPLGYTYSEAVCRELAEIEACPEFRLILDMAYCEHHLYGLDQAESIPNMLDLCAEAGHPDRPLMVASMSKITFPGGGMGCLAASTDNLKWFYKLLSKRQIGADKLNQLRHVRYLKDLDGLREHMRQMADIIRPKFEVIIDTFRDRLAGIEDVRWTEPKGGYFIGLYVPNGLASRIVELAAEAGVKLTPAGNPFPYKKDPNDNFLRIAPSFPPLREVKKAAAAIATCIRYAVAEQEEVNK